VLVEQQVQEALMRAAHWCSSMGRWRMRRPPKNGEAMPIRWNAWSAWPCT